MTKSTIETEMLPGSQLTEHLSRVATRGSADHHWPTPTLFVLHEGQVMLGPPRHRIEGCSPGAWLLPAAQFVARWVLSPRARWHEVRLAQSLPPSAPFAVAWSVARDIEDQVARGGPEVRVPIPTVLPDPWPCTPRIRQARRVIEGSLRVGIDELCEQIRTRPHALSRCFRRELGTTPHQYQLTVRLSRASQDLRRGVPAADAAMRAGFYDQSHLGRHMRQRLGITPAAYAGSCSFADVR